MLIALALAMAAAEPQLATHARGQSIAVSTKDFPKDAYRRGERGRTVLRFLINADGRVEQCEIVKSSGSQTLDQQGCEIAKRGRFSKAARDTAGQPVPEWWRWAFEWLDGPRIHMDDPVPEGRPQADVVIGTANWERMPRLDVVENVVATSDVIASIERILDVACKIEGARPRKFDISVRYALKIASDGEIKSMLVEDVGCRPLAHLVSAEVFSPSFRQKLTSVADRDGRWHTSTIRFKRP